MTVNLGTKQYMSRQIKNKKLIQVISIYYDKSCKNHVDDKLFKIYLCQKITKNNNLKK